MTIWGKFQSIVPYWLFNEGKSQKCTLISVPGSLVVAGKKEGIVAMNDNKMQKSDLPSSMQKYE